MNIFSRLPLFSLPFQFLNLSLELKLLVSECRFNAKVQPLRHEGTRKNMKFKFLSTREESIAEKIVDAAFAVHKVLGPGLLERVYEVCFCHELSKRELKYKRQVDLPITYDGMMFDEGLRLDVLVEELII